MEDKKKNKGKQPGENKGADGKQVKIRFLPGKLGEPAIAQDDGTHLASAENAAYWVKIGYAEYVA